MRKSNGHQAQYQQKPYFGELVAGQVFRFPNNENIYMKTDSINGHNNWVSVANGYLGESNNAEPIELVHGRFVEE